ncbi:MAG: DUF4476 domain-containing protein [Ignavibacterium sp.]|jgi:hypothetical protein|nr:DUF4476 domain-containing protein [Ignavibacterium sp.]
MKLKIIIIVVILISISFAQEHHRKERKKYQDIELKEIVLLISSNFEKLEREYLTKLSYRDYNRAKSILIDSYDLLNSIPLKDDHYEELPLPISNSDFNGLIESVKNEGFDSDRLNVISIAADYHYFLVEQVLQLMDLFVMSDSKLEVVKMTYPNVIDKNNNFRLISAFTFSSDKEEVKKIISSYPGR